MDVLPGLALLLPDAGFFDGGGDRVFIGVQLLDEAAASAAAGLKVALNDGGAIVELKKLIERERRGRGRIAVVLDLGEERSVEVALPGAYAISAATRQALQRVPGIVEVQEI